MWRASDPGSQRRGTDRQLNDACSYMDSLDPIVGDEVTIITTCIDLFISKGVNPNIGLMDAIWDGNRDLVEFLISKGANDFYTAVWHADMSKHKDLIDFFNTNPNEYHQNNLFI